MVSMGERLMYVDPEFRKAVEDFRRRFEEEKGLSITKVQVTRLAAERLRLADLARSDVERRGRNGNGGLFVRLW